MFLHEVFVCAILSLEMKRFCYTCLFALVLVACSATRDARLLEAVTFSYGNYGPADVRQLLEDGAEVNARNAEGLTPLLNAYGISQSLFEDDDQIEDAVESVRLLLAHGADVKACTPQGHNALDLALGQIYNEPLIQLLREQGLKPTNPEYELVWHASHNHAAEVKRLLDAGVSPNACSVQGIPAIWATMPIINHKPLSGECMELLLAAGADVSSLRYGFSLLDEAVMNEKCCGDIPPRYTQLLRDHGAKLVKYAEAE